MIGKLTGKVDSIGDDWVILDVGGVGYEISCGTRILASLPAVGETVTLAIETHVRETEIRLFGFSSEVERRWFRLLQSVQGVGAKSALAVLSTLTTTDLTNAIALQDKAVVTRAPGIGPKVAGRIVSELKDKAPALTASSAGLVTDSDTGVVEVPEGAHAADAVSALTNLGYPQVQASNAISAALKSAGEGAKAEELIRRGLKELAK